MPGDLQVGAMVSIIENKNEFYAWLSFMRRYFLVIALGNLVWEALHMPLYTIWYEGTWKQILFAGLHCTGGNILIALASLMLALVVVGNNCWPHKGYRTVAIWAIVFGLAYTVYSEWLNVYWRESWAYADQMPVLPFASFEIGLTPLLQWLVIPLASFWWARGRMNKDHAYRQ